MSVLARLLSSRRMAWAVVIFSLALTAICGVFAARVGHDDDLLAFLPQGNEDVAAFYEINRDFGSLDVGIVGIETADPFDADFLARLRDVTRELNEDQAIQYALSLTNLEDVKASEEGGIERNLLVPSPPKDDAEKTALREAVMSRDMVVGQLISSDARAVVIYCFSELGTDPKDFTARVKEIVRKRFPTQEVYWGGAPFISTYIYTATQDDLRVLTPWAVLVVILMVILSFRDAVGAFLSLVSTAMGIVTAVGLMGMLGINYNLVLSSMPVILFSCASAYAIHVIARYYQVADHPDALGETLRSVGPTVLAAGMTTVVGLLSYQAMDIEPMRTFGLFSAIGVLWTLVLSLTFVPAMIVLLRLRRKHFGPSSLTAAVAPLVDFSFRRPRVTAIALVLVCLVGAHYALRVDSRMDQTAFFTEGSPPDRADRFLLRHFGGATFIQVAIQADVRQPEVLRELERIADRIDLLPSVSNVQHIGLVLEQVNLAMEGERRIPDQREQVEALYRFLTGNRAVAQLVTTEHDKALLVIKVGSTDISEIESTLKSVEQIASEEIAPHHRFASGPEAIAYNRAYVLGRIRALLSAEGIEPPEGQISAGLERPAPAAEIEAIRGKVETFLASDECLVDLETDERRAKVAGVLAPLASADEAAVANALSGVLSGDTIEGEAVDAALIADLSKSLVTPLREIVRRENARVRARSLLEGVQVPDSLEERIAQVLPALDAPRALVRSDAGSAAGTMSARVNGLPVLHRGMGQSSTMNQILSMSLSMVLVFGILLLTFRSIRDSLIATAPMVVTLLVVYGGMGWLGVHLDVGTSMLASIVVGAGSDYAVHLLVALRRTGSLKMAVEEEAVAIWTDALMVAAGFYVLTLGEARPLQNVGGLTAAAMLTAALSTFVSIPLFVGRWTAQKELSHEWSTLDASGSDRSAD
jgi:uncharacterized protein